MTSRADPMAPLPRGRHQLSRGEVEQSQRLRLAVAMAEACAESGFANVSVKAVLERAGVSRLTFYELYDDKLGCFLEALDLVGEVLVDHLGAALHEMQGDPLDQAVAAVVRYLGTIGENLPFARLFIVEVHAAGPVALTRRARLQSRIVDALVEVLGVTDADTRFACEAYVAAVSALVTLPVATADLDALDGLRDPLVDLLRRLARSAR